MIVLSWIFILATVGSTQIRLFRATNTPANSMRDLSLQIVGKYLVGTKVLLGSNQALRNRFKSIRLSFQKDHNARRQLLVVPIVAEIFGKQAALAELKRLAESPGDKSIQPDIALFVKLYRDGDSSLEPQQRLSIQRYGWLGQLALSRDKPSSDPARSSIIRSALRTVIAMVALMFGILGILAAGIVLLVTAAVLSAKGRLRSNLAMPESPDVALLEAFAIYLTGFIAVPAIVSWMFPRLRYVAISLAILAVIVSIFWPRFRGSSWQDCRRALGWNSGNGFFREIGAGIVGYIAGFPLLVAALAVVAFISRYSGEIPGHPIVNQISRGPLYLLFWTFLACVWAPVVEETFFRGALFGYLRKHVPRLISGVLVGLLFGIIHPQGLAAVPVLAAIGFTLCMIREWRGSLIASMSAHALNNASALLLLLLIVS